MLPFPVICGKLLTLLIQKGVGDGLKIEIATPFFRFHAYIFPIYRFLRNGSQISKGWDG